VPTQRSSTVRLRTSLFQEATEIVDREYASELSLDGIARRVASSRRQLQRAYAEIGRTTFRDHLTRVRMQKAADMLSTRSLTVREVAHRVGYRQPAQFAKAFRRYQGVAPSDFRAGGTSRNGFHAESTGALPMDGRFQRAGGGAGIAQDDLQAA
jgi:AraC family transcriptional regulator of adaptative response / methylphosphotriester-DNA alkyltransferase methyltransferase